MTARAVILAAGRGARLGELTRDTPKPLLRVGRRPIIVRILDGLMAAGIDDVTIVTGYLGDQIEREIGNGSASGIIVRYVRQETLDGSARGLSLAREFVAKEPFVFAWGDIVVAQANYREVIRRSHLRDGSLAVNDVDDPAGGGAVYVDDEWRVTRLVEKPAPGTSTTRWNNAGFGVLPPAIWEHVDALVPSARGEYELPQAIAAMVAAGAVLRAVPVEGLWFDAGTPESLAAARAAFS